MAERRARKISLAPFDENIAAHTSCKDTRTEKLPTPSENAHLAHCWQGLASGPWGSRLVQSRVAAAGAHTLHAPTPKHRARLPSAGQTGLRGFG